MQSSNLSLVSISGPLYLVDDNNLANLIRAFMRGDSVNIEADKDREEDIDQEKLERFWVLYRGKIEALRERFERELGMSIDEDDFKCFVWNHRKNIADLKVEELVEELILEYV